MFQFVERPSDEQSNCGLFWTRKLYIDPSLKAIASSVCSSWYINFNSSSWMHVCISDVFLSILVAYVQWNKRNGKEMVKIGNSSPFFGHSLSFYGTCHRQSQLIITASTWFSVGSMAYHTGLRRATSFTIVLIFGGWSFSRNFGAIRWSATTTCGPW